MENQKTKMETAREECRVCGSDGIRTVITHPGGCVQVLFTCLNPECSLGGKEERGAHCPHCKEGLSVLEVKKDYTEYYYGNNEYSEPELRDCLVYLCPHCKKIVADTEEEADEVLGVD